MYTSCKFSSNFFHFLEKARGPATGFPLGMLILVSKHIKISYIFQQYYRSMNIN